MYEKFVYWLKDLTPWVCVVNIAKELYWLRILWILRPLGTGVGVGVAMALSGYIGTVSAVIGTIQGIYVKRGQSLEFVHPVFYIFTDGFGIQIFEAGKKGIH